MKCYATRLKALFAFTKLTDKKKPTCLLPRLVLSYSQHSPFLLGVVTLQEDNFIQYHHVEPDCGEMAAETLQSRCTPGPIYGCRAEAVCKPAISHGSWTVT